MPGARAVIAHLPLSVKSFGNEGWKIKIIHQLHLLGPAVFAAYLRGKFVILLTGCALECGMLQLRLMLQERKLEFSISPLAKLFSPLGISWPRCSEGRIRDLHTGVTPGRHQPPRSSWSRRGSALTLAPHLPSAPSTTSPLCMGSGGTHGSCDPISCRGSKKPHFQGTLKQTEGENRTARTRSTHCFLRRAPTWFVRGLILFRSIFGPN